MNLPMSSAKVTSRNKRAPRQPRMSVPLQRHPPRTVYHQSRREGLAGRVGGNDHDDNPRGDDDITNVQPCVPHTTINLSSWWWQRSGGRKVASGGEPADGQQPTAETEDGQWTTNDGCRMMDGR